MKHHDAEIRQLGGLSVCPTQPKMPARKLSVSEQMRFWGKMEAEIAKAEKRKREQRSGGIRRAIVKK